MTKYLEKVMLTFRQFLEEGKKKKEKEIQKLQSKQGPLTKKEVMKILNSQGGIGAKAVQKYHKNNPDRGPRHYRPDDVN